MSFPLTELVTQTERKPSLVDDAYTALKDAIRQGVLPSGYQGSEQEIADKLNMSRTPVHEAIIRLQSEGLQQTAVFRLTGPAGLLKALEASITKIHIPNEVGA